MLTIQVSISVCVCGEFVVSFGTVVLWLLPFEVHDFPITHNIKDKPKKKKSANVKPNVNMKT